MVTTTRRRDPQAGAFDVTLENPELVAALELIEAAEQAAQEAVEAFLAERELKPRALSGARRLYKETIEATCLERNLGDDQRIRVGPFVIKTRRRAGGGFEVPAWAKTMAGSYQRIEEAA